MALFSPHANVIRYTNGTMVKLTATAHEFLSADYDPETKSGTYLPDNIEITATFQGDLKFGSWSYSTDGETWVAAVNDKDGITFTSSYIRIQPNDTLFVNDYCIIMCMANDGVHYDTITLKRSIDAQVIYSKTQTEIKQTNDKISLIASAEQLAQFTESQTMMSKVANIEVTASQFRTTVESNYATKELTRQEIFASSSSMKNYTDNAITQSEGTTKEYANSVASTAETNAINNAKQYADGVAGNAETSAKQYADDVSATVETNTKNYASGVASTAETNAKGYADTVSGTAERNAKGYADSVSATAESNAKGYADDVSATAESNAKDFATDAAGTAESNAKKYTNDQLKDYTTTVGMKTAINQSAESIVLEAERKYATKEELTSATDGTYILQSPYEYANGIYSFTAKVYKNGEDSTQRFQKGQFEWYLKTEKDPVRQYVGLGYTYAVRENVIGYGGTVTCRLLNLTGEDVLIDHENQELVDSAGNFLTVVETKNSLEVETSLYQRDYIDNKFSSLEVANDGIRATVKQQYEQISRETDGKIDDASGRLETQITVTANNVRSEVSRTLQNYNTTSQMNSAISQSASSVTQSITKTVSDNYTTKEEWSTLEQTVDGINTQVGKKVGEDEIISSINQSPENIKIIAKFLQLEGIVTANEYFKILQDGSFETIYGKIAGIIIANNSIYSKDHPNLDSENPGFILKADGSAAFGDGNSNYIKFYKNGQNKWIADAKFDNLTIATADNLIIEGSTAATKRDITAVTNLARSGAETATNFLYYDESTGLVVSETGDVEGSAAKPYNVRITGSDVNFRKGKTNMASFGGTEIIIFRPNSTKPSMKLDENGMYFYKLNGIDTSAKYTDNGFEVLEGKIGSGDSAFIIDSKSIHKGTIGESNSIWFTTGSTEKANIADSGEISGWAITSGSNFGVTRTGKLYSKSAQIAGKLTAASGSIIGSWNVTDTALTNGNASLGNNGIKVGDAFSVSSSGQLNATGVRLQGDITADSGRFSGEVYATKGSFRGTINAEDGTIGGFTIAERRLYSGAIGSGVYLSPNGFGEDEEPVKVCGEESKDWALIAGSNFGVMKNGKFFSNSGKIAGFEISSNELHSKIGRFTAYMRSGNSSGAKAFEVIEQLEQPQEGQESVDHFYVTYGGKMYSDKAELGGILLDGGVLYVNNKKTYNSSNEGFMFNKDGVFSVGDGTNYVRFYQDKNGVWKLDIKASSLTFGGSTPVATSELNNYATKNSVDSLVGRIDDVDSAATDALRAANEAAIDAADAADVAESAKSKTFVQSGYPSGPYHKGDIWIATGSDTTYVCVANNEKSTIYPTHWEKIPENQLAKGAADDASNALAAANQAKSKTNYITYDYTGLHVHYTASNYDSGSNILMDASAIKLRSGTTDRLAIKSTGIDILDTSGNALMALGSNTLTFSSVIKGTLTNMASIGSEGLDVKKGKIGNITITGSDLYSGSHDAWESTNPGFILRDSGAVDIGDGTSSYFRFNPRTNAITMKAKTIRLGDSKSNQQYIVLGETTFGMRVGDLAIEKNGFFIDATSRRTGTPIVGVQASGQSDFSDGKDLYKLYVGQTSSSKRYKNHVRDMTYDDAKNILNIKPIWFKYKEGQLSKEDEYYDVPLPGFYAEDVEANFKEATIHNEDGSVETWEPRNLIPAMLMVIKHQQEEIDSLKETIEMMRR